MRAVLQRVTRASVSVEGVVTAAIEDGLLALVGVARDDTAERARSLARKMHELRILRDGLSIADLASAAILVVSQFTLYGDVCKGRRPSWSDAAPRSRAEPLIEELVRDLRARGATVATGVFGADMAVELINDGPVTLIVEI